MAVVSESDVPLSNLPGRFDDKSEINRRLGTIVGGTYRLLSHIGSGSSGHIFSAEHMRLGRRVAVKILRSEVASSDRAASRFRHEAKAVARLQHEHIVSVFDCGELDDQRPFLVMELLDGEDLRCLLRREGALPARRAVQIVIEACRALTPAHEAKLVHRDLKPENLFIARRSTGEDWCKVLDFGVARLGASVATARDTIIGTVRYMAPEQISDSRSVDQTTDVYALGAILYECLAGVPLCEGASATESMYQIMNLEPVSLLEKCPHLPRVLAQVVHRSIAKARHKRPQSTAQFAELLRAALDPPGASSEAPDSTALTDDDRALSAPSRRVTPPIFALGILAALGVTGLTLAVLVRPTVVSSTESLLRVPSVPLNTAWSLPPDRTARAAREVRSVVLPERGRSNPEHDVLLPEVHTSPAKRNRTHPVVRRSAAAEDSKKPPAVRVGGFDPANPYGD